MKRVYGNPDVSLFECVNPIKNKWRVRWDIQKEDDGYSYMETEFNHKPSLDEIKQTIIGWHNNQVEEKILSGFTYEDSQVWLSTTNQFNYKSAYDLAVQKIEGSLPVTFKFGTDEQPKYREFTTLEELTDFYLKSQQYIQNILLDGWKKKDSFNESQYLEKQF